jgi:hypothetical protein
MAGKILQEQISANARRYSDSYVPVFKVDCREKPYHCGTLFLISHAEREILITARHVLDRDEENPCDQQDQIYAFSKGRVVQIEKFQTALLPLPSGGYLDLCLMSPEGLNPRDFVEMPIPSNCIRRTQLHRDVYVAACGFPSTKNARRGRELTRRPYGYFGRVATDEVVRAEGYDPRFHFGIEIDLKRVYREGLNQMRAVDPDGISGGPVFAVHDFSQASDVKDVQLAGVVIARGERKKLLVCVRAEFILHEINALGWG